MRLVADGSQRRQDRGVEAKAIGDAYTKACAARIFAT
jgi:hypothetical protein